MISETSSVENSSVAVFCILNWSDDGLERPLHSIDGIDLAFGRSGTVPVPRWLLRPLVNLLVI
jgi:hypothetical protein